MEITRMAAIIGPKGKCDSHDALPVTKAMAYIHQENRQLAAKKTAIFG